MIKIIAVGKINKSYLDTGINHYLKQLKGQVIIEEVKDEPNIDGIKIEGSKILSKLNKSDFVIGLVILGDIIDSETLAKKIDKISFEQGKNIVFIIGGSYGLDSKVMERLDYKLSISKMTFPHQIVRLLLIEQIYRGFMILKNHPYHK